MIMKTNHNTTTDDVDKGLALFQKLCKQANVVSANLSYFLTEGEKKGDKTINVTISWQTED